MHLSTLIFGIMGSAALADYGPMDHSRPAGPPPLPAPTAIPAVVKNGTDANFSMTVWGNKECAWGKGKPKGVRFDSIVYGTVYNAPTWCFNISRQFDLKEQIWTFNATTHKPQGYPLKWIPNTQMANRFYNTEFPAGGFAFYLLA
ncbi:hypothetical protein MMC13_002179 [Lambiella insularis]|nr:hypothetical protein [Lambiella insularis]